MSVKLPLKIAGSSERAGLNEPPDAGPIASAAVKMKRPIRSGAITPFQGARSSVATVQMTMTKSAVAIPSSSSAPPLRDPDARVRVEVVDRLAGVDDCDGADREEPADQLRDPVGHDLLRRELASRREAERDRRVVVAAADLAERGDRQGKPETEREGDSERRDRSGAEIGRDGDRVEAEKEEEKGSESLGSQAQR